MHLRCAVFPIPPYAFPPTPEDSRFTGPIPTMIRSIADKLNFSYDIATPSDKCTVSLKLPNGTWTGYRGMIDKNETDIALGPEILVPEQIEGVRMGNYYHYLSFNFVATAGDPAEAAFSNVVITFDLKIWIILLCLLLLLSISCSVFDFTNNYFSGKKTESKAGVIEDHFWMFLATFFLEGTPREPSNQKNRFVFGVWLMAVLVMMNAFTSLFKSALMIKGPDDTMYTVKDLAERPELTIYFRKSGYEEKFFEETPLKYHQVIWQNIVGQNKRGLKHGSFFVKRELYDNVNEGKGVLMAPIELAKAILQNYCPTMTGNRRFYFIQEEAFSNIFTFYTSASFPVDLLNAIKKRVRWIVEGNLFNRWLQDCYKDYSRKCLTTEVSIDQEYVGLAFQHLKSLFILTLCLHCFCCSVLLIEILVYKISSINSSRL